MDAHAVAGAVGQGTGKLLGDVAPPVDETFQRDAVLRARDGGEHGGEDLVAVLQGADPVAVDQRRTEQLAQRTVELRIADAVGQLDPVADFLFVGDEVAREQRPDRAGRRAGAEEGQRGGTGGGYG